MSQDARLDLIEDAYRSRYDDFVRTASAIAHGATLTARPSTQGGVSIEVVFPPATQTTATN